MVSDRDDGIAIGKLHLYRESELLRGESGEEISLRPQAFAMLCYLVENADRLVSKDELIEAIWKKAIVSDDSLTRCIHDIRQALGANGRNLIQTVPRRGYRFVSSSPAAKKSVRHGMWLIAALLALAVYVALVFGLQDNSSIKGSTPPVIAVLPFVPQADDDQSKRLANGLTDDVITDLATFPEFSVIARETSTAFAKRFADTGELAAEIGADFVLKGMIQRNGDRIRISTQLIESSTLKHVWTRRWDRQAGDLFAIQIEIASSVANRLGNGEGLIQALGRADAARKRPSNLNAYELYLLGTENITRLTKESLTEAQSQLTRATELDPNLARAWVELFHVNDVLAYMTGDYQTHRAAALEAAERAVAIDPKDAEAHAVLAMGLQRNGNITQSKAAFEKALQLAPNSFEILTFYSGTAVAFGDLSRAATAAEKAIRLNPEYPSWAAGFLSSAFFNTKRYEETLKVLERQDSSSFSPLRWAVHVGSLAALGRSSEAELALRKALEQYPTLSVEALLDKLPFPTEVEQHLKQRMVDAGFPICAQIQARQTIAADSRLVECD